MNTRDINYFITVANTKNLRKASEKLFISQPALTKCINRLELQFNCKLFKRSSHGLELTQSGIILLKQSQHILQVVKDTTQEMTLYNQGSTGHIRLGVTALIMEFFLPQVMNQFLKEYPLVKFDLFLAMGDVLTDALQKDKLDLIITPTVSSDELEQHYVINDRVVVVARKDHPLSNQALSICDLIDQEWILANPQVKTRVWLENQFKIRDLSAPNIKIQANSLVLLPPLITSSNLLSFISQHNLSKPFVYESLTQINVDELVFDRTFSIHTRKKAYLSPVLENFIDYIKDSKAHLH